LAKKSLGKHSLGRLRNKWQCITMIDTREPSCEEGKRDVSGSVFCPKAGLCISDVEYSGSNIRELIR
jgi:hypothetical protein